MLIKYSKPQTHIKTQ